MFYFMGIIKKIFKKVQKKLRREDKPMPRNPKSDDVWLVSFPRSGVTWMTFLLANLMVKFCRKNIDVNFKTIYSIIPDIHYNKENIPDDTTFHPFPRMIKSHSEYLPDYKRVIYLIRDPRDVMVSYYDYLTNKISGPRFKDFSDFIKNRQYGVSTWVKHIKSWINKWDIIIRYEDLKTNPKGQLEKILSFLNIKTINEDDINFAIEKSSLEEMQSMEKEGMVKVNAFKKDFAFIRKGDVGGWKDVFKESDTRYYREEMIRNELNSFLEKNEYF